MTDYEASNVRENGKNDVGNVAKQLAVDRGSIVVGRRGSVGCVLSQLPVLDLLDNSDVDRAKTRQQVR
jgi:hypothetical protein